MSNLAHAYHRTVVCTIHQPSTDIFFAADDLLVLAEGEVLYMGEGEAPGGEVGLRPHQDSHESGAESRT